MSANPKPMVEIACEKCGKVRLYGKYAPHPALCRRCSYDSMPHLNRFIGPPAPPVKLTCVGYKPYDATSPKFARNCPRETEKKRKTLKFYNEGEPRVTDDGEHAFIDAEHGLYRCKGCANALFLTYKLEGDVKEFLRRAKSNETVPKIRSLDQLMNLRRECSKLSYTDESGAAVVFDPHAFKRGDGKSSKWGPRKDSTAQATGLLIQRSREGRVVKGLCQFCGKLVLSNKGGRSSTVKVHAACYQSQSGYRKGIPPPTPSRGRPVELENLRKYYSWAIRHRLAGHLKVNSLGNIAKEFNLASKNAVVEGIEFILTHLPPIELVPKNFRERISRLLPADPI